MADERIAEMIAQSNAVLAATLAGALQGLRVPPVPTMKLDKFMGYPRKVGDPTVAEWLQEFDVYALPGGSAEYRSSNGDLRPPGRVCSGRSVVPS